MTSKNNEDEQINLLGSNEKQLLKYTASNKIIQNRETDLKQIESDMYQLNDLFVDISNLVQTQKFDVNDIENNIISAEVSTNDAVKQLKKAEEYQKSAYSKKCCLILFLLIIVAMVILILIFSISFDK